MEGNIQNQIASKTFESTRIDFGHEPQVAEAVGPHGPTFISGGAWPLHFWMSNFY